MPPDHAAVRPGDEPGRTLPDPGFGDDDGAAPAALDHALRQYAGDGRSAPVLLALSGARLLVPVVAMPGETETDDAGLMRDKSADIAALLMHGRDGRTALPAFSSLGALTAWDAHARPVPVSTADAARAAVQEQAEALVVDVAGPTTFVVETAELAELAAGNVLIETAGGFAWLAAGTM